MSRGIGMALLSLRSFRSAAGSWPILRTTFSLYTHGMSTRDIESHIRELYGVEMSEATISHITDRIVEHVEAWKSRRLEKVYLVVWMDAIVFKVRQDGKVIDKAVQIAVGLNNNGYKEVLGMWLCQNESAAFWMSVITNLKSRGVEDILITSTDNLKGFTDAIKGVYPEAKNQICIVHQLRNSLRLVVWKDKKAVAVVLKEIYNASNADIAYSRLDTLKGAGQPNTPTSLSPGAPIGTI